MQIRGKSFWLALNQSSGNSTTDAFSGSQVAIPRGNWVRFLCALFVGDPTKAANFVDDISNIQSATLVIRKSSATGDLLYQATQAFAAFDNPACAFADWASRASRQFSFLLTDAQTNWTLGGGWDGTIYFVVGLVTAAEGPITVASGKGSVFEDGIGDAPDTVVENPAYLTEAQSDARYAGRTISQAVPSGQDYVDVDISSLAFSAAPTRAAATLGLPAAGADLIGIGGIHVTSAAAVRVYLQAATPAAGYTVTLIVAP